MGLGKQSDRQNIMWVSWDKLPKSGGHAFYDKLQAILTKNGFDKHAEKLCAPFFADKRGRRSIPPGRYFRMLLIGYFEAIHSERGIEWRCADSLSLREFLLLDLTERVPDHSTLSRTRSRLSLEVHDQMFSFVLEILAKEGLIKAERLGVDASTMEANAALKTIVRKDTGEDYNEMLTRMAKESGIETPTADDLVRMDRQRKGKKLSNKDWESPTDPDARIAKMKDGRTRLAYKPEHAVDLDSGAIVATKIHHADKGDTKTLPETLAVAEKQLNGIGKKPTKSFKCEVVADKGYHSRDTLKNLEDSNWKSRIAEPKRKGLNWWKGDKQARRAVYNNRARISTDVGKAAARKRTELVERSFEHNLDRGGGMRRVWLHGTENIEKRYLVHVAGFNLSVLMRNKFGVGTPREAAAWSNLALWGFYIEANSGFLSIIVAVVIDSAGKFVFAGVAVSWVSNS